jgi:hypothetical protein
MLVDYENAIEQEDIATIYLNGYPFRGVGSDSILGNQEFVWAQSPSRSNSFSFEDMDEIEVGLVARCRVNFKYMNIKDYMQLRRIVQQRHFVADFFDIDQGKRVTREVYCPQNELKKLYTFGPKLVGVLNMELELVGTNRDLTTEGKEYYIRYEANGGTGDINMQWAKWGQQITLDSCAQFARPGYRLVSLNTKPDGSGWHYLPNQSITAFGPLELYAIWG